jgi:hypothetical protein
MAVQASRRSAVREQTHRQLRRARGLQPGDVVIGTKRSKLEHQKITFHGDAPRIGHAPGGFAQ